MYCSINAARVRGTALSGAQPLNGDNREPEVQKQYAIFRGYVRTTSRRVANFVEFVEVYDYVAIDA